MLVHNSKAVTYSPFVNVSWFSSSLRPDDTKAIRCTTHEFVFSHYFIDPTRGYIEFMMFKC